MQRDNFPCGECGRIAGAGGGTAIQVLRVRAPCCPALGGAHQFLSCAHFTSGAQPGLPGIKSFSTYSPSGRQSLDFWDRGFATQVLFSKEVCLPQGHRLSRLVEHVEGNSYLDCEGCWERTAVFSSRPIHRLSDLSGGDSRTFVIPHAGQEASRRETVVRPQGRFKYRLIRRLKVSEDSYRQPPGLGWPDPSRDRCLDPGYPFAHDGAL